MKQLEDRCNECRQSMVSVENKYEQCGTIHSKADDLQHAMNALERNTSEALHTKANDVLSAQMSFASSKQDELQAIENAKGAVEAFTLASNSGDYVSTPLTILKHKLSATKLVGIAATLTHAKADLASAKAESEARVGDLSRVEEARDESLRKFATCESEAKDLSTTAQKICRPAEGVGAEHE